MDSVPPWHISTRLPSEHLHLITFEVYALISLNMHSLSSLSFMVLLSTSFALPHVRSASVTLDNGNAAPLFGQLNNLNRFT